jgi:hypothetical protein
MDYITFVIKKRTIFIKGKKGKVHPRTGCEGLEGEQMHSYTLSLTLALDGVGVQPHASAALLPGKTRYPWYRRLVGLHGRAGRMRKDPVPMVQEAGWVPRPGWAGAENFAPTAIRSRDSSARSESIH